MENENMNGKPTRFQGDHIGDAEAITLPVKAEEPRTPIAVSDNGLLIGKSIDEQWRIANAYHKSGLLPKHFNSPEKILTGMQFAYELGLKPLTAMRQIAVINGIPSMYGDLPLAVCRAKGAIEYMQEYFVDKSGKRICEANGNLLSEVFGAVCISKRRGEPEPVTVLFTFEDAKKAGLLGKNVWAVYPKRMLQMRARSQNLKDNFPDAINGMSIAEYDHDVSEKEIESGVIVGEVKEAKGLNLELIEPAQVVVPEAPPPQLLRVAPIEETREVEVSEIKPAILEKKAENAAKAQAVKLKVKKTEPEPEPEISETKPSQPAYIFPDGRFVGQDINAVSRADLETYFYSLKAKEKISGPDAGRNDRIGVLARYLGL